MFDTPGGKIAYSDMERKLANHRFVNILAFESAIQLLNGLAANVHNPTLAVKIQSVYDVSHKKLVSLTQ